MKYVQKNMREDSPTLKTKIIINGTQKMILNHRKDNIK